MTRPAVDLYIGAIVHVGRGRTEWRITDWLYFSRFDLLKITHAALERVDRPDVHTSATLERLVSVRHDNLSRMA